MRRLIIVLTVAGMTIPLAAHALNERVWLMLNGGGGTYVISDLNAEIDAVNAAYAGTGWSFARVKAGHSFGGAMGFETSGQWNFGLGFDRLDAATRASDATGALEYRLTANVWRVFGEYAFRPIGLSTFLVGGSIGIVQEDGTLIESTPGTGPLAYELGGSSPAFEGYVGGNWWVTERFSVTGTAGYRFARVKEANIEGFPLIMTNGEAMSLDYSGPTARLGIKLAAKTLGP